MLLVVLWLLIGTRLRFLAVELLSTIDPLCSLSVSLELAEPVFVDVGLAGFTSRANAFLLTNLLFLLVSYYFLFLFLSWVVFVGFGSSD